MGIYQSGHDAMPPGGAEYDRVQQEIRDAYERGKRDGAAAARETCVKAIDDEIQSVRQIRRLTERDRDTVIEFLGYARQHITGGAR